MADGIDLEARLDALFASEPTEFTATRDALARDLRADGRDDDATSVKSLRRPTVAVAAVNRIARERPDEIAELVAVGSHLAALQSDPQGDRDELRELTRERRALLTRLTDGAARSTERPDAARSAIAATLDAASLDELARDDLLRGRITRELSPATRFVAGDDAPPPPATTRRRARPQPPPRDELAARRARAELEAVQERANAAEETLREHVEAVTDATAALDAAQRHVTDLESALADARVALVEAKRAERDAHRAAQRARTEQERVAAALRAAKRSVEATEE